MLETVIPYFMLFTLIGILIITFWIGPEVVLRWILSWIPPDPHMGHAVALSLAIIVCLVFLIPLWPPLLIVTGMVFGFWMGFLICYVSIVIGSVLSFVIGRTFCARSVRDFIEESDYSGVRRMMLIMEEEDSSMKFIILFRFLPLPLWLRNYAPSVLNVSIWLFLLSVCIHAVWICGIFAVTGAATKDIADVYVKGQESIWDSFDVKQVLIFSVALISTCLMTWYAWREYTKRLEQEDAEALRQEGGPRGGSRGGTTTSNDKATPAEEKA